MDNIINGNENQDKDKKKVVNNEGKKSKNEEKNEILINLDSSEEKKFLEEEDKKEEAFQRLRIKKIVRIKPIIFEKKIEKKEIPIRDESGNQSQNLKINLEMEEGAIGYNNNVERRTRRKKSGKRKGLNLNEVEMVNGNEVWYYKKRYGVSRIEEETRVEFKEIHEEKNEYGSHEQNKEKNIGKRGLNEENKKRRERENTGRN